MTTKLRLELGINDDGNTIIEARFEGDSKGAVNLPAIIGRPGSMESEYILRFFQVVMNNISVGWGITAANQLKEWGNDGHTQGS